MDSDQDLVMPRLTDHQWQQYRAGRDARRTGSLRVAPRFDSDWRVWLAGWDSVGVNQGPRDALVPFVGYLSLMP